DQSVAFSVNPFGNSYTGAVRVAVGDVTGDSVLDVAAVTNGSGSTPARVAIIDGSTHAVTAMPAFVPSTYTGQLSVAVGDVTGDGVADIALGSNENAPHARVFRGGTFAKLADFKANANMNFKGRTYV